MSKYQWDRIDDILGANSYTIFYDKAERPSQQQSNQKSNLGEVTEPTKDQSSISELDNKPLKSSNLTIPSSKSIIEVYPNEAIQGRLSNCYLMSSLSAMAQHPELIQRLFNTKKTNSHGLFSLNLCKGGVFKEIMLDNFFPCSLTSKLRFARPSPNRSIWPLLIEKGFAKIYGAYWNIGCGGSASLALKDLTGAPSQFFNMDDFEPKKIFSLIKNALDKRFIVVTQTKKEEESVETDFGLDHWHYYAVLGYLEIGKNTKLLKLRNPWGKNCWKGEWGVGSEQWTPKLRRKYQIDDDRWMIKNGVFYINLEDFVKNFIQIDICYYSPASVYTQHSVNYLSLRKKTLCFQIFVKKAGKYFLTFSQPDDRIAGIKEHSYASVVLVHPDFGPELEDLEKRKEMAENDVMSGDGEEEVLETRREDQMDDSRVLEEEINKGSEKKLPRCKTEKIKGKKQPKEGEELREQWGGVSDQFLDYTATFITGNGHSLRDIHVKASLKADQNYLLYVS